jgi:hypothetical protein
MKKITLLGFLFLNALFISAQCVEGKIIDANNNPIPYATVFCEGISKGTTSNIEGYYKLDLPKGEHKIIIRYLGYKTKEITVECSNKTQNINIVLQEQAYKIPEVRILASGEDPLIQLCERRLP